MADRIISIILTTLNYSYSARYLHEKLSSPDRRKRALSPTEAKRRQEAKQLSAETNRDRTVRYHYDTYNIIYALFLYNIVFSMLYILGFRYNQRLPASTLDLFFLCLIDTIHFVEYSCLTQLHMPNYY
jgi:hypothetical protein